MKKLNNKEKLLATSVGLLLGIFALKSFVLGPIYEKTAAYWQEIEQAQLAIRKYMAL